MNQTVALLEKLVGFDTVSNKSNLPLVDWAVDLLKRRGARLKLSHDAEGGKANILASFGPEMPGGIVLSAHTDVVPVEDQAWNSDPFVLMERSGRLYGRGTADMKGFVAACLAATEGFASAELARPIHLAFSYDEEVGCWGVPCLIEDLLAIDPQPALAIIGEPTGMRVGDRHRGFFGFRTRFLGHAAHSSDPSAGASAIHAATALVAKLQTLGDAQGAGTHRTTFNVGRIEGGTAINIVPSLCEVTWEFRPAADADTDALKRDVESFLSSAMPSNIRHETQSLITIPPLAPVAASPAVAAALRFGGDHPLLAMPFGTEAGFFQAAGIPSVVCGPGFIAQAHQADEWISLEQLNRASVFLERLTNWAEQSHKIYA